MTRIALFLVVLSACKIRNEQSCDIPGVCVDTDGGQACTGDPDCGGDVCKLPEGRCVGCIDAADCDSASTSPVCNATANTCEGCKVSADCGSQACNVATGACFTTDQVAYVEAGAAGNCDALSPCDSMQEAFDTNRLVIKIQGTAPINGAAKLTVDRDLLVLGDPGATIPIVRAAGPIILEVVGNTTLTIKDVELSSSDGDAIKISDAGASVTLDHVFLLGNAKHGVVASPGDLLVMRGCVMARNEEGGLSLSEIDFEITNTMLVANGSTQSTVGGMRSVSPDPTKVIFEFNTIADNTVMGALANKAGVDCAGTAFPAHNNIVAGFGGSSSLDVTCMFDHSLFTGTLPPGAGNLMVSDVRFENTTLGQVHETDFYRLKGDSPAVNEATASEITVDIDGQLRPQGDKPDMGADEVMP